jgi:hypothetical protein
MRKKSLLYAPEFGQAGILAHLVRTTMRNNHLVAPVAALVMNVQKQLIKLVAVLLDVQQAVSPIDMKMKKAGVLLQLGRLMIGRIPAMK